MGKINGSNITYTADNLDDFNAQLQAAQSQACVTNVTSDQGQLTITFDLVNAE